MIEPATVTPPYLNYPFTVEANGHTYRWMGDVWTDEYCGESFGTPPSEVVALLEYIRESYYDARAAEDFTV